MFPILMSLLENNWKRGNNVGDDENEFKKSLEDLLSNLNFYK